MGYQNRRYRVVDGKLAKRWDGADEPGWFVTKAEAWAAVRPAADKATDAPPAPPTVEATVPPAPPTVKAVLTVGETPPVDDAPPVKRRRGRGRKPKAMIGRAHSTA